MGRADADHEDHEQQDHDRGLAFDLSTLLDRRRVLGLFAGAGIATLVGCTTPSGSTTTSPTDPAAGDSNCAEIPGETAGPFPGDGSNGPNVLTQSGIVRSDIRSSFGTASGVVTGVPLTINLTILDLSQGCSAYSGAAVYLWHCDIDGNYSMYSQPVADDNYLRGVQESGADGAVTFRSIFPGAYSGRWPHIHFEIYPSLAQATAAGSKMTTSQLAFPADVCQTVYASAGYGASAQNLAQSSLDTDNVFRDGYSRQLAAVNGSVASGLVATLTVPV